MFSDCKSFSSISLESKSQLKWIETQSLSGTLLRSVVFLSIICHIASSAFNLSVRFHFSITILVLSFKDGPQSVDGIQMLISNIGCSESPYYEGISITLKGYRSIISLDCSLNMLSINCNNSLQFCFLLAQCRQDLILWNRIQNSLNILLELFETSPMTSTEALLDDIEKIKVTWYYIRGIRQIRHFYDLFIERNYVVGFEL
jgi:hypothetical protein